mmetsp:Transcript_62638/g.111676  ORF Transcript_62638/g.111676 Transcript_62638/m.111676 type:complete len:209 (-) Transcript_62638:179-805(-)
MPPTLIVEIPSSNPFTIESVPMRASTGLPFSKLLMNTLPLFGNEATRLKVTWKPSCTCTPSPTLISRYSKPEAVLILGIFSRSATHASSQRIMGGSASSASDICAACAGLPHITKLVALIAPTIASRRPVVEAMAIGSNGTFVALSLERRKMAYVAKQSAIPQDKNVHERVVLGGVLPTELLPAECWRVSTSGINAAPVTPCARGVRV